MFKAIKVTPESEETIRREIGAGPDVHFKDMSGFYLVVDTSYVRPWDFYPEALFKYHYAWEAEEQEDRFMPVREIHAP